MSKYDEQYLDLVERILTKGYYDQNRWQQNCCGDENTDCFVC